MHNVIDIEEFYRDKNEQTCSIAVNKYYEKEIDYESLWGINSA